MDGFIGNEGVVAYLKRAFESGTLFHAFLFVGPDGIGKRTLAEMLTHSLLCPQKQFGGCGECAVCRHVTNRTHPDFFYVSRQDGKQDVSVGQIRTLRESLTHTAFFAGPRVAIIDDAETMNGNAANTLLKQLEEAPNAFFFLLAESARSIPETVQSRVQRFDFQPQHRDALTGDSDARLLALGAPGRLKRFNDDTEARREEGAMLNSAHLLLTAPYTEQMKELDRIFGKSTFAEQRAPAFRLARYLVALTRDQLRSSPYAPTARLAASGVLDLFRFFDQDITPRILLERFIANSV